jgi:hypothetical protein
MFRGKIYVNKMQSSWMLEHVINIVSIVLKTFKLTQWLVTASIDQGHLELVSTNCAHSFNKITHYNWFSCIHSKCTSMTCSGGWLCTTPRLLNPQLAVNVLPARQRYVDRGQITNEKTSFNPFPGTAELNLKAIGCLFTETHVTLISNFVNIC